MKKIKLTKDEESAPIKINRSRSSGKKRTDLFARLRNTEHPLDYIVPSDNPPENINEEEEVEAESSRVEYGKDDQTRVKGSKVEESKGKTSPVKYGKNFPHHYTETSPTRNFTKFTNSIVLTAIPEKFFRGQSKHTYDVLYQHTRGAINPIRQIQLTKSELMKLTGLSDKTVQSHIKHLKQAGLIMNFPLPGSHKGWIYEVFVPQELESLGTNKSSQVKSGKEKVEEGNTLPLHPGKDFTQLDHSNPVENKDIYKDLNTTLKTRNNDDEVFANFIQKFQEVTKEITGRGISKQDTESLEKLADLLILELRIAARRTSNISSVPAFLTEVLRRKLRNLPIADKNLKAKPDNIGKTVEGKYEIKPLNTQEKEEALSHLQEFASDGFLEDFKKWYTEEDWTWLMQQIKTTKSLSEKTTDNEAL